MDETVVEWKNLPLECRKYLLGLLSFRHVIRFSMVNKRYLKWTARNVITEVNSSDFSFSTAAHCIGRMQSLQSVSILTDASSKLPRRVAYLFKQNKNLTKLRLTMHLHLSFAERIVNALPPRLKSLQIAIASSGFGILERLTSLLERLGQVAPVLEELQFSVTVNQLEPSCLVPLYTFQKLRQVAVSPLRIETAENIPQPFASKIVFNTQTLLVRELLDTPFDIKKARYLISQGADPNILLPTGDRPILCCGSIEAMRFMFEETSFDPTLPLADGSSITAGACMFLPFQVLHHFLLGDHVEKYEAKMKAPFADLRTLMRDYYQCSAHRPGFRSPEHLLNHKNLDVLLQPDVVQKYESVLKLSSYETGDTLLHLAAAEGATETIQQILKNGRVKKDNPEANVLNRDKMLPLHHLRTTAPVWAADALLRVTRRENIDFFSRIKYHPRGPQGYQFSLFQTSIRLKRWKIVQSAITSENLPNSDEMIAQLFQRFGYPETHVIRQFNNDVNEGIDLLIEIMKRWKLPADEFRKAPSLISSLFWSLSYSATAKFKQLVELGVPIDLFFVCTIVQNIDKPMLRFLIEKCDSITDRTNYLIQSFNVLKHLLGRGHTQFVAPILQFISTSPLAGTPKIILLIGSDKGDECLLAHMIAMSPSRAWHRSSFFRTADLLIQLLQRVAGPNFDWKYHYVLLSDVLQANPDHRSPKTDDLKARLKTLAAL
eukprot:TRINITY_DN13562_c0_g1_i1.p1 TRINITY_DN13562_c0_g1~~TRINITY_DN13562_c0_g1_i1.p1  ORF type:complete len:716 (-),score=71.18 TRINITY_DN13562_c0_g1_i1:26-2173(-)